MNIGICVITYNRINSLKRVLQSLNEAQYPHEVDLIISVDKSDTEQVADYARLFDWLHGHKEVIIHKENLGLRKHVLSCGELLNHYDALVVLEDDISVAESFFYYVEQCVEKYKDDDNIAGISLYNFPLHNYTYLPFMPLKTDSDVFLMQLAQSWGQVWMRKQWNAFIEWYKTHNEEFEELPHLPKSICNWPRSSWLKYHNRYCIEQNKFFVYPYDSLSTNNCEPGTHNKTQFSYFQAQLLFGIKKEFKLNPIVKYDGFFENMGLSSSLGIKPSEICIDLYGVKHNRLRKRYWLSCSNQPYKLVRTFALTMKPIEFNILYGVEGTGIYLYDTYVKDNYQRNYSDVQIKTFLYATDMNVINQLFRFVKNKIYNLLNF